MRTRRFAGPEWLVTIGGSFSILALAVAAIFVPEIRWLHLVQSSLYVAAITFSLRRSRWGYRKLADRCRQDISTFILTFIVTTGFMIAATAILAPDYLVAFTRALHPHWPWTRS